MRGGPAVQRFDRMDATAAPHPAIGHIPLAEPRQRRQARRRPGAATAAGLEEIPGFGGAPRPARRTKGTRPSINVGDHQQVAAPLLDHAPNRGGVTRAFLLAASLPSFVGESGGEA